MDQTTSARRFGADENPGQKMLPPPSRTFEKPRIIFRFHKTSTDGYRNFLLYNDVKGLLDTYLTVHPSLLKRIKREEEAGRKEFEAQQRREYAESTQDFLADPPEVVEAWLERARLRAEWNDDAVFQKTRGRSVLTSFIGIFISLTGVFPSKVEALGLDLSNKSHVPFLIAVIGVVWYNWAATRTLVRKHMIDDTMMEIKQRLAGVYKTYDNRWTMYIEWLSAEKNWFYERVHNWIFYCSVVALVTSVIKSL